MFFGRAKWQLRQRMQQLFQVLILFTNIPHQLLDQNPSLPQTYTLFKLLCNSNNKTCINSYNLSSCYNPWQVITHNIYLFIMLPTNIE
jgi:hypothetical protein